MCDEKGWLKLIQQIANLEEIEITVCCHTEDFNKNNKSKKIINNN